MCINTFPRERERGELKIEIFAGRGEIISSKNYSILHVNYDANSRWTQREKGLSISHFSLLMCQNNHHRFVVRLSSE